MQEIVDLLTPLASETRKDGFQKEYFESALSEICLRELHIRALNSILQKMTNDIRELEIFTSGAFFNVASAEGLDVTLVRHKQVTRYVYSSPAAYSQTQISTGSCLAKRYRVIGGESLGDVFDRSRAIEVVETARIASGMIFSKAYADIVDLVDFDNLPSVYLRLSAPPRGGYEWAFDRATLAAKRYSTVHLAESNLCAIFDVLSEVGDALSEEYLEKYTTHSYHFVRWKAVQSLAALNPSRAFPIVSKLSDDAHPDVRKAARAALASNVLGVQ